MKKLLLLAVTAWVAVQGVQTLRNAGADEPLFDHPYVVVYGRDSCGLTQAMRRQLARAGVPFDYQQIDVPEVEEQVHARMERAGLSTASYQLPVVDVSGQMLVSPQADEVATAYRTGAR